MKLTKWVAALLGGVTLFVPGETFTYEFDLRQSGTGWYHSHTMLQEQRGLFGALVKAYWVRRD